MEKARMSAERWESYEINAAREELSSDLCAFLYGESESDDSAEAESNELSAAEHSAFLKCACLLFAAAVGIVMAVLLI